MNDGMLKGKLEFYAKVGMSPTIIFQGDKIWKRGWLGYQPVASPSGTLNGDGPKPRFKTKVGNYITESADGSILPGIGVIAANLTEIDGDLPANLRLVLNAEPTAEGIAFLDKTGEIVDWISRDDVPDL